MIIRKKDIKKYRDAQLKSQRGLDPITGLQIRSPTADHDHQTGKMRQVLDSSSNQFEGKVSSAYKRFLASSGCSLRDALLRLISYLDQDYSKNPLHPGWVDLGIRRYGRMVKKDQEKILKTAGIKPGKTSKERTIQYRKLVYSDKNLFKIK